jgi:hypothetical protein
MYFANVIEYFSPLVLPDAIEVRDGQRNRWVTCYLFYYVGAALTRFTCMERCFPAFPKRNKPSSRVEMLSIYRRYFPELLPTILSAVHPLAELID